MATINRKYAEKAISEAEEIEAEEARLCAMDEEINEDDLVSGGFDYDKSAFEIEMEECGYVGYDY